MTDQNQQRQETPEEAVVREGVEQFAKTRQDRDYYRQQAEGWERAHSIVENENQLLRQQVLDLEHRAAFYMRHSSELIAHMEGITSIIGIAQKHARDAAYRPTNAAPARPAQQLAQPEQPQPQLEKPTAKDSGEPIPKFLKNGPADMDALAAELGKPPVSKGEPPNPPPPDRT
jgi:hypothetical protein